MTIDLASIHTKEQLRATFKKFDYNGNGLLSLAEIDLCLKDVKLGEDKPVLIRAYKVPPPPSHNRQLMFLATDSLSSTNSRNSLNSFSSTRNSTSSLKAWIRIAISA
jgi:hypothetical protein